MADRVPPGRDRASGEASGHASSTGYGPGASSASSTRKLFAPDNFEAWEQDMLIKMRGQGSDYLELFQHPNDVLKRAEAARKSSLKFETEISTRVLAASGLTDDEDGSKEQPSDTDKQSKPRSSARLQGKSGSQAHAQAEQDSDRGSTKMSDADLFRFAKSARETWERFDKLASASFAIVFASLATSVQNAYRAHEPPESQSVYTLLAYIERNYNPASGDIVRACDNEFIQYHVLLRRTIPSLSADTSAPLSELINRVSSEWTRITRLARVKGKAGDAATARMLVWRNPRRI